MLERKNRSVIILAAGDGSRLKSSTPKVFHKIGGLSLLDHVIKSASDISDEISVVLKPQYEDFKSEVNPSVKIALQKAPLGTGDAVRCCLENLQDSSDWVYVVYADIPLVTSESLNAMYDLAINNTNTGVVVLAFDSSDSADLGRLEKADKDGIIKKIVEAKDVTEKDQTLPLCNAGLLIKRDVLNDLLPKITPSEKTKEIYITEIVDLAFKAGYDCRYYETSKSELSGANTRAELAILERYFQDRMRFEIMNNGVTLVAPETVFFSYDTEIENDVIIHPYVTFGKNVKIKSGAEIGPFCVIEGANIEEAKVGPFSRVRPQTEIKSGAKIGNFVEIKNSVVKEGTKVNHLSYIGDSDVGKNTNIGAGTITCNYDGFRKHQTKIGENVFIGSNSAIVAPIDIEDGALIGAGSVITKNVEADSLAISRAPQKNIENGSADFRKSKSR